MADESPNQELTDIVNRLAAGLTAHTDGSGNNQECVLPRVFVNALVEQLSKTV